MIWKKLREGKCKLKENLVDVNQVVSLEKLRVGLGFWIVIVIWVLLNLDSSILGKVWVNIFCFV
jgi:hypothetical protein